MLFYVGVFFYNLRELPALSRSYAALLCILQASNRGTMQRLSTCILGGDKESKMGCLESAWEYVQRRGHGKLCRGVKKGVHKLCKIVETMSYTENVAQFLESLDSFYERVPQEDLNMLVGNIVERVVGGSGESSPIRPSSPNGSPSRAVAALAARFNSSLETSPASSCSSPSPRSAASDTEDEEEEFIDTIELNLLYIAHSNNSALILYVPKGTHGQRKTILQHLIYCICWHQ
ncbi:hypothetical protein J437_LFUL016371 [Ladona fulva]|uniref:Uncharacterized protein n=1 Tax=Ladona fulva TaxID=123851 RepID=A0A8K0KLF9_LADFU|nr:hypothetical protein J437_LFUL016371 [Ladona fulva]